MIVILNDKGAPDWDLTSGMLRSEHITWLGKYMEKVSFRSYYFGPGSELAFRCPGCGRWCPHETASVDHIIPRTKQSYNVITASDNTGHITFRGTSYVVPNKGQVAILNPALGRSPVLHDYNLYNSNQDICYSCKFDSSPKAFPVPHRNRVLNLLENDIENLQFMCASCNSKKSNNTITPGEFRPQFVGASRLAIP